MRTKLSLLLDELCITRWDILVVAVLLCISAVMGLMMLLLAPKPKYVVVKTNGQEVCRLPLDEDGTYHINDTNVIEISGGRVRMIEADCPDKVCVHSGAISHGGQTIVCAPNRVVVSITGDNGAADVYTG